MGVFRTHIEELAFMVGAVAHKGTAGSGTASTLVDSALVDANDDVWKGHRIYTVAGTGAGQERAVSAFTASSDTLTVAPNWTTNPDATTQYILLRKEWTIDHLRNAWKQALGRERKNLLLPKVDSTTITLDSGPPVVYAYNVPTGFYAIQHILREAVAGEGNFTAEIDFEWWNFNRGTSPVQIVFDKLVNDQVGFIVDGCLLRIIGQQVETIPDEDTDSLTVPTGGLIYLAAALALSSQGAAREEDRRHRMGASDFLRLFNESRDRMPLLPGSKIVSLD